MHPIRPAVLVFALSATPTLWAQASPTGRPAPARAEPGEGEFRIDEPTSLELPEPSQAFAVAGATWWSAGVGVGLSEDSTETNPYAMVHWFLDDGFEFNITVGGFYHAQDDEDAASANFAIGWRWHFKNEPGQTWYIDLGIGLLGSSDDVPEDGTSFNFTPRAGIGTTIKLRDDSPARLDLGVRWYHISNASSTGSDDNPSRDGAMIYAGVSWPF